MSKKREYTQRSETSKGLNMKPDQVAIKQPNPKEVL